MPNEWVTNTDALAPGILNLEVLVTDNKNKTVSKRFWVNIPQPPPPPPVGAPVEPTFAGILKFREEWGLDVVDPVEDELERNDRIWDLIGAWHNPQTPLGEVARASWERWGVPLRPQDVAELEYREAYIEHDGAAIEEWVKAHAPATYAGYYVDHASGGLIHVGFTSAQTERLSEIKQQVSLMAPERLAAFPSVPLSSLNTLEATTESLDNLLQSNQALAQLIVDFVHGDSLTRPDVRFFVPLVKPRGFSFEKVPGALQAPGMGDLNLIVSP